MNQSIMSVNETTRNTEVYALTEQLLSNSRTPFRIGFVKKNGQKRFMTIVPKHEYNDTMGIRTTEVGRKIVSSKVSRDMIVVNEIYTPEDAKGCPTAIRPRTINLRTVFSVEIMGR